MGKFSDPHEKLVDSLRKEIYSLRRSGYKVTENCKCAKEVSNYQISSNQGSFKSMMVGPEEFESSSIAPEATSLDQTSRRPLNSLFSQGVFSGFLH
jgi:hypothetical protein